MMLLDCHCIESTFQLCIPCLHLAICFPFHIPACLVFRLLRIQWLSYLTIRLVFDFVSLLYTGFSLPIQFLKLLCSLFPRPFISRCIFSYTLDPNDSLIYYSPSIRQSFLILYLQTLQRGTWNLRLQRTGQITLSNTMNLADFSLPLRKNGKLLRNCRG